jgi:molecular chaperone DnaJ
VRGDHYVTLIVRTPVKLSPEAKEVLKHFDYLSGNSLDQADDLYTDEGPDKHKKKKKGFMNKIKEAFDEE